MYFAILEVIKRTYATSNRTHEVILGLANIVIRSAKHWQPTAVNHHIFACICH